METSEIIGIAAHILLTIVVGIIFQMENRIKYYKNYLRYRMYSVDIKDIKSSTSKLKSDNIDIFNNNIKDRPT